LDYKKLGNTDIEVSTFALGCWPFAGGDVWGEQDDGDSIAAVHAALDAGINFFDTAEGYGAGKSEQVLGEGLVGRRKEAIIGTKISPPNLDPKLVEETCDRSLKNLGTDYIDLYQIHWPNHDIPQDDQWEALSRLVEKGKVRALGVCNFAIDDLTAALDIGMCQSDQLPYNLAWRAIEYEIQPLCSETNTGIICYSPLAQGVLSGRYKNADEVPEGLARSRHYSKDRPQSNHGEDGCEVELFEAVEKIRYVADQMQEPMASVALAWVRSRASVLSLLIGARNPEELSWNLPAIDLKLPADASAKLSTITERVKEIIGSNPDMWNSDNRMK
jgi:aryl-alcohol dehydrogenase-like predicted oxidoreductase